MSIKSLYPDIRPSLNLNFANSRALDGRITFTRDSTATYVGANGLIQTAPINEPRFDHDPVTGESLGLLIEDQRTNIINNTENVGSWSNATATQETANPIKGLYTHRVINLSSDGDSPYLLGSNYTTGKVTMSMYIDAVNSTSTDIIMYLFGGGYISTSWNLSTGVPVWSGSFTINGSNHSNGSQQVIDCGGGIYRLVITADYGGSSTASRFYISPSPNDTTYAIVAGIQMEQGAFPTSYIPTSGSAVTRIADFASMTGTNFSSWYNPHESSILCNFTQNAPQYLSGGASGNERAYRFRAPTGSDTRIDYVTYNAYHPYIAADGSVVASLAQFTNLFGGLENRTAVCVKENDFASFLNGNLKDSDTNGTWPPTNPITEVSLGSGETNNQLNGHIKSFSYYPERLTNAQLQLLTQ